MKPYFTYISDDMLDYCNSLDIICHGCNTKNIMGAGLALQIKTRYPGAFEADREAFNTGKAVLGSYSVFSFKDTNTSRQKHIVNMYIQDRLASNGSRALNYEAIYKCFEKLYDDIKKSEQENFKIGIPKIGCGLAGGNWDIVQLMIEYFFMGYKKCKVFIFTP